MAAGKEIRTKIASIKNTQKITRAMEMVAASKMRKAQDRMRRARPYADKIREVCAHLERGSLEYRHPYTVERDEVKAVGVIVITTDKGLCGGLNTNALRAVATRSQEWEKEGKKIRYTVFGNKGAAFFGRIGGEVISQATALGDAPELKTMLGPIQVMTQAFLDGEVDEVHLGYARFINTMSQENSLYRLLPLDPDFNVEEDAAVAQKELAWDYLYEPGAEAIIDLLMERYIESVIYQAVADNAASEQAARMVAMKAASDNAGNIIDELLLAYNKERQAAITTEISEIVGGAAAV
ncbi:MAG: F0F1 ATP synthase subunit gamma [Betaproteobacteria bacterium AqS2]|uniref:ATP synthase gamma chain n=1 Tax=Candidatus Amphirhobacter heronislandensis TaxID=1732024 RepID=A0A930Y0S7_9GAMM|nr:F0F1 ATP synthase subunit gamma [Betaproteobacteria bacterium AqS2]